MLDEFFRLHKERWLRPLANWCAGWCSPLAITALGLLIGLAAAFAASRAAWGLALGLWCVNRVLDGLDGVVARVSARQSELGGYLDIVADFTVYGAMPIGLA
ncbi:MAG: CDP-alcohol phosphatidyltransferase family protein, partial [Gemmatimonadaceae bacterium]|nr:CDP-alcohol phosphatidyltransferase family protein [Gemmatimonadaceae bacterium]